MSRPVDPSEWTAFVLGELDPVRQAELEVLLADDVEAQRLVAETRATASRLVQVLRSEPLPPASTTLEAAMSRVQGSSSKPTRLRGFLPRTAWGAVQFAAMLVVIASLSGSWLVVHRAWQANDLGPVAMVNQEAEEDSPASSVYAAPAEDVMDEAEQPLFEINANAPGLALRAEAKEFGHAESAGHTPMPAPPLASKSAATSVDVDADVNVDADRDGGSPAPGFDLPLAESPTLRPRRSPQRSDEAGGRVEKRYSMEAQRRLVGPPNVGDAQSPHPFPFVRQTATWDRAREALLRGERPSPDAIRLEEVVQAYTLVEPLAANREGAVQGAVPAVMATLEAGPCPWRPEARLAQLTIFAPREREDANRTRRVAADLQATVRFSPSRVRSVRWLGSEGGDDRAKNPTQAAIDLSTKEVFVALYEWEPTVPGDAAPIEKDSPWATLEFSYRDATLPADEEADPVRIEVLQSEVSDSLEACSAEFRLSAAAAWLARSLKGQEAGKEGEGVSAIIAIIGDDGFASQTSLQAELLRLAEKLQTIEISGDTE